MRPGTTRSSPATAHDDASPPERAFAAYLAARPRLFRGVLALWCFLVASTLASSLSNVFDDAADARAAADEELQRVASLWQAQVASQVAQATSLAIAVAGFGIGDATGRINHTAPVAERLRFNNEAHWQAFASGLVDAVPGITAFEIQPSGVVAHVYPSNPAFVGFDLLNFALIADEYRQFIRDGRPVIVGPSELLEGGIGLVTRFPVYVGQNKTFENFWGAGACVARLSDLFDGMDLAARVRSAGYKLLAYTNNHVNNPDVTPPTNDIYRTEPSLTRAAVCGENTGHRAKIGIESQNRSHELFICLAPAGGLPSGSASAAAIAGAVLGTLAGASALLVLLVACAFAAFEYRHRAVPHRSAVASDVCVALVAVKDLGWWQDAQAPHVLAADLVRFHATVAEFAAAHGPCHHSGRVSEGCAVVVSDSPAALHDFALACREHLSAAVGPMAIARDGAVSSAGTGNGSKAPSANRASRQQPHRSTKHRGFAIGCALHYGPLAATYDADADHFRFGGAALSVAAAAIDATDADEVAHTEEFHAHARDQGVHTIPEAEIVRALGPADQAPLTTLRVVASGPAGTAMLDSNSTGARRSRRIAAALRSRGRRTSSQNPSSADTTTDTDGVDGERAADVQTAVSAATGALLHKRVALLAVDVVLSSSSANTRSATAEFAAAYGRIVKAAAAHRGTVLAVVNTRLTIAFNAMRSTANPVAHALFTAEVLRSAALPLQCVITVTAGPAFVAALAVNPMSTTSLCMSAGRARLHCVAERVAAAHYSHFANAPSGTSEKPLISHTVIDVTIASEASLSHELECIGPLSPPSTRDPTSPSAAAAAAVNSLLYLVHAPWPTESDSQGGADGDDDHHHDGFRRWMSPTERQSRFTAANCALEAAASGRNEEAAALLLGIAARRRAAAASSNDEINGESPSSLAAAALAAASVRLWGQPDPPSGGQDATRPSV